MTEREGVTVEFFGLPRLRAGRAELTLQAETLAELLEKVERACPELAGLVQSDGRLSPHYLVSLNGEPFVSGTGGRVRAGDCVLLLSADAGG